MRPQPVISLITAPATRPMPLQAGVRHWPPEALSPPALLGQRARPVAPARSTAAPQPIKSSSSRPALPKEPGGRMGYGGQAAWTLGLALALAIGVQQSARHPPGAAWTQTALQALQAAADDGVPAATGGVDESVEPPGEGGATAELPAGAGAEAKLAAPALDADVLAEALTRDLADLSLTDVTVVVDASGQVTLQGTVTSQRIKTRLFSAAQALVPGGRVRDLVFVVDE